MHKLNRPHNRLAALFGTALLTTGGTPAAQGLSTATEPVIVRLAPAAHGLGDQSVIPAEECWSTNGAFDDFEPGEWPSATDFFAGDPLAYATGPIRVFFEDGFVETNLDVKHELAEGRLAGTDLDILDRAAEEILVCEKPGGAPCDQIGEFTDWFLYLQVPRNGTVPAQLGNLLRRPLMLDWEAEVDMGPVGGYECAGSWTVHPS